jgi:GR25 family glycosyltransferase involved in LPS biosynthesis
MKRDKPSSDLHDYFPYRVCINLDRRPERWSRMQELFLQHQVNPVERFAAIDGLKLNVPVHSQISKGGYGCLLSHVEIVKRARERQLPTVLIFEDDCCFDPDFNNKFSYYIRQLPSDWDMFLLGGMHIEEPNMVTTGIARLKSTCLSHAYALNHSIYDAFIELCEPAQEPIDMYTLMLQEKFNCYGMVPDLVWQAWEILESDIPIPED